MPMTMDQLTEEDPVYEWRGETYTLKHFTPRKTFFLMRVMAEGFGEVIRGTDPAMEHGLLGILMEHEEATYRLIALGLSKPGDPHWKATADWVADELPMDLALSIVSAIIEREVTPVFFAGLRKAVMHRLQPENRAMRRSKKKTRTVGSGPPWLN